VLLLTAGCAAPVSRAGAPAPTAGDQTDVWFVQHMVPHLRQTTSIAILTRGQITDPALDRLAGRISRSGQADIDQLQRWLDRRGLAPHGHSHQRIDNRRRSDLERLSRLRGTAFDRALLRVMTARHRAAIAMAAIQRRQGSLPEVRQLAGQLVVEQQAQLRQMDALQRSAIRLGLRRRRRGGAAARAAEVRSRRPPSG
jgi:uncharacterized protein (DUF305 family)